jgi:lipid II:glycine glycyltransferase (peptidoglycan interpeptide bridge formation enzyme)
MELKVTSAEKVSALQIGQLKALFTHCRYASYAQSPTFGESYAGYARYVLVTHPETGELLGYAMAKVQGIVLATLTFGPVCAHEHLFGDCLRACVKELFRLGIKVVRIQPPAVDRALWQEGLRTLKDLHVIRGSSELNWSTRILDITPSSNALLKSFSENHRRSIRKGIAAGLVCSELTGEEELRAFATGYCNMYRYRKLPVDFENELRQLKQLFKITRSDGFIWQVKKGGVLLGGIVLLLENKKIFYLQGFSDPAFRKTPAHHLLFFTAIEAARDRGYTHFDFGGYGREGQADEQVVNINRFKDGFRGERIDHPDTVMLAQSRMYGALYKTYSLYKQSRKWLRSIELPHLGSA